MPSTARRLNPAWSISRPNDKKYKSRAVKSSFTQIYENRAFAIRQSAVFLWPEVAVNIIAAFLLYLFWNIQLHMKLYIIMRYVHKLSCCAMTELCTTFVSKPFYSQNFVLLRDYTKILALNRQNSLYNSDSGSYN